MVSLYEALLISVILASWSFTLRRLRAMIWETPYDVRVRFISEEDSNNVQARDLAAHCSKYVISEDEISDMEMINWGNALVISRAEYRGRSVVLKRWHGAVVPHDSRIVFTKVLKIHSVIPPALMSNLSVSSVILTDGAPSTTPTSRPPSA
jgi:hypothetical protein